MTAGLSHERWFELDGIAARIRPERAWVEDAACRGMDPSIFFVETGGSSLAAKEVCRNCPVCRECDDYAIRYREEYGIWGGRTPKERRPSRRGEAA